MDKAILPLPDEILKLLNLEPLPFEGGFFRETYRSKDFAAIPEKRRNCATCIYFLLQGAEISRMHKLASDEIWFYHAGTVSAEQTLIFADGTKEIRSLGTDFANGDIVQSIIPAGVWQKTVLKKQSRQDWALFSTVVCPGFEIEDFVPGNEEV